ncbi:MAG: hypothetical protein V4760_16885 [Bdellovibrionota bacterium]
MKNLVVVFLLVVLTSSAFASSEGFYAGAGLYAQNSLSKTTKSDDGSGSVFGSYYFPLVARYVHDLSSDWSIAPALFYTLLGRSSGGGTATTTFIHLSIPAMFRTSGAGREFEFFGGPGISMYQIKGAGGTKQLSNGTGTSTFAVGGGDSTSKLVTLDLGAAWLEDPHRISFEIFVEGLGSAEKRTFNLLATYMYHLGG